MNNMRAIGAGLGIIITAALIAGCGGGSTSGTNSLISGGTAPGNASVQSSATQAITITVKIPSAAAQQAARRNPAYVSPATTYISANTLPDNVNNSNTCTAPTCTVTLQAPLTTTSIVVQLGGNNGLLSQATQNVSIVAGQANNFTFVFNGVVASIVATSTFAQAVVGVPQSFAVTLTPYDVSGDQIMSPGSLVDTNGDVLIASTGSPQTFTLGITGSNASAFSASAPAFNTSSYLLTSTVTYSGAGTAGSSVTFIPATSVTYFQNNGQEIPFNLPVNPKSIQIVANPAHTPPPSIYQLTLGTLSANTSTALELATYPSPNPAPVYLSVMSNFNDAGAHLALSSDSCTGYLGSDPGLDAAFPASPPPTMPSSLSYPFTLNVAGPAPTGNNVSCAFTVTDTTNNLTATTTVGLDSTTLTVSGKARK